MNLTLFSSKATIIVKNSTHLSHSLFQLLPSGKRYWSIKACSDDTTRETLKGTFNDFFFFYSFPAA